MDGMTLGSSKVKVSVRVKVANHNEDDRAAGVSYALYRVLPASS